MPRIENHQLKSRLSAMWDVLLALPVDARNSDPVNNLIEYFLDYTKQFMFDLEIAKVQWEVGYAEELRIDAQRRLTELRDRGHA